MDPLILGTLVLGLLGAVITNYGNDQRQKDSQNWNERMVDKANAYNDPVQQVERLKNAGLNPTAQNMSGGDILSGSSSSVPSSVSPSPYINPLASITDLASAFNQYQQGKDSQTFRQARLDQIIKENNKLVEDAKLLGLNADNQRVVNQYTDALYTYQLQGYKYDFGLKLSQIRYCNKQYDELVYRINELLPQEKQVNDANLSRIFAEVLSINAVTAKTEAETEQVKASTGLIGEQTNTEVMKQAQLDAQTQNLNQDTIASQETLPKILEQMQATIDKISAETGLTEQESYWYLFKLSTETEGKVFGVPMPGAGGITNNLSRSNLADQVNKKYK